MSTAAKRLLTPQEYLAKERAADFKSEFLRGETFAMAGARFEHNAVKENLIVALGNRFKGGPCRTLSSDMRVKVSRTGLYTYPDVVIVCGEMDFEDEQHDTLLNPRCIIEVLSDTTEKYDRGAKFGHYRQVASLQEYVLVAQDRPLVERYVRQADDSWVLTAMDNLTQTFAFASVPAQVPLAEIYDGVDVSNTPPR